MPLEVIESVQEMQRLADIWRAKGDRIALVPTMGYFHEGHLSLIRKARDSANIVVASIYVNPTQFGPGEDLESYPRNLERDIKLAAEAGCDFIFVPSDDEMYPENYLTFVNVEKITAVMCGASRPGHFKGVTTVVAKLFNIVKPHVAVFGQKDAQQAVVIKRMARDLNYDVIIEIEPIIRESDGLAMSSRNEYLSEKERRDAPILYHALTLAEDMIRAGERRANVIKEEMKLLIEAVETSEPEYIVIVNATTLEDLEEISGDVLVAVAVRFGKARLIDNILIAV